MSEEKKIEITENPSLLAFESKLICSDALMVSGQWEEVPDAAFYQPDKDKKNEKEATKDIWQPIKIQEKSVRGTISNRDERSDTEHNDHAKFIKEISNPNIQTVDNAALPPNADTLKISFSLRVLGNLAKPTACNMPDYQSKLAGIFKGYIEEHGFTELANRYAMNIANGRFLWRNRVCVDAIQVHVKLKDETLIFEDAYRIGLKSFDAPSNSQDAENVKKLASLIEQGLSDTTGESYRFFEVEAFVKMGNNQVVYPSQEMVMEKAEKGGKSKYLYQIHDGNPDNSIAAMHSQKIGNAIRTIDDWHSEAKEVGAIAVEPYGSVTNRGKAYRPKSNGAFYTLLDSWMQKDKKPTEDEQHYIMAVFIRGGVFSDQSDDKKKEKKAAK